jgi:hypothetical protein
MLSSEFIQSLSDDELGLLLYFVNVVDRPLSHNISFEINDLKFFRKDVLTKKLLDSFNKLTLEGHPTFVSLMEKFGVKVEIKKEEPKKIEEPVVLPITSSVEPIVFTQPEVSQSVEVPKIEPVISESTEQKL